MIGACALQDWVYSQSGNVAARHADAETRDGVGGVARSVGLMAVTKRRSHAAVESPAAAPTPAAVEEATPFALHARRIALITAGLFLPYGAWISYLYLHLQSGLLRPAVAVDDPRQLLIVGTQSAGTTDIARQLQELGLEVEHESSDATWMFARDGTVSWMHALRFLPGNAAQAQQVGLCGTMRKNMGFHPAMFRTPTRPCSYRKQWDSCWAAECRDIVRREWGCALRTSDEAHERSCETPFARALLQVRHPLRVVESLSVKFCPSLESSPHAYAQIFLTVLWPDIDWQPLGCAKTFGWLWTLYNEAMLRAHAAGAIDAWFRIEDVRDPCTIALKAGLLHANTSVNVAHAHAAAVRHCAADGSRLARPASNAGDAPNERRNRRNQGQVSLRFADVVGEDEELAGRMQALAETLGYSLEGAGDHIFPLHVDE